MSGYLGSMDAAASAYLGEHTCRRVVAGDVETARERLVYALERLDYNVLGEQPVQAKRAARKGSVTADFLDYARRLTLTLRPQSAAATLVTFDFLVTTNGFMTQGDRKTLEREADALVALAAARPEPSLCAACGTENTTDSRFCRLCGTPNAVGVPAEVGLMNLTAGARGSLQEIVAGLGLALLTAAIFVSMIVFGNAKAAKAGWALLAVTQFVAWWMMLYGVLRLHRTLNPKEERQRLTTPAPAVVPPLPSAAARERALPPRHAHASVTEATTDLLAGGVPREPVPVPVRRKASGDTDPIADR